MQSKFTIRCSSFLPDTDTLAKLNKMPLRSRANHFLLGLPSNLPTRQLPTNGDVINYVRLLQEREESARARAMSKNIFKPVTAEIMQLWQSQGIPLILKKSVQRRVSLCYQRYQRMNKMVTGKRDSAEFGLKMENKHWDQLFDVAICRCSDPLRCECPWDSKVPPKVIPFIKDQRGPRKMFLGGMDREESARRQTTALQRWQQQHPGGCLPPTAPDRGVSARRQTTTALERWQQQHPGGRLPPTAPARGAPAPAASAGCSDPGPSSREEAVPSDARDAMSEDRSCGGGSPITSADADVFGAYDRRGSSCHLVAGPGTSSLCAAPAAESVCSRPASRADAEWEWETKLFSCNVAPASQEDTPVSPPRKRRATEGPESCPSREKLAAGAAVPVCSPRGTGGSPMPSPVDHPVRLLAHTVRPGALIIGDSLVRHAGFAADAGNWRVTVWVPPANIGQHWAGCLSSGALMDVVRTWASTKEMHPAAVALWLGGNDVYPRDGPRRTMSHELWSAVTAQVAEVAAVAPVTLVGPTPRPARDGLVAEERGVIQWEDTAAFDLERKMVRWTRKRNGGVSVACVGRCLTERYRRGYQITSAAAAEFFQSDGIHLTAAGYRQIASRLPPWMTPRQ